MNDPELLYAIGACLLGVSFTLGMLLGAYMMRKIYERHLDELGELLKCDEPT